MDGFSLIKILLSSSAILSLLTILIRAAFSPMAAKVWGCMVKFNCAANRMALIMRNGSSLKVCAGASGV